MGTARQGRSPTRDRAAKGGKARDKPGEVLVGSGSWRVDPGRALEILRSRQMEAQGSRMALWIRAAVLRGAPRIDFRWSPLSLTIRFGGRPLAAAELSDPFSVLLSGSSAEPAARWLALALLHTALPKVDITLESGAADGRRAVRIDAGGLRSVPPGTRAPAGSPDTIVKVRWPLIVGVFNDPRHPYCWQAGETRPALEPCPIAVAAPRSRSGAVEGEGSLRLSPVKPDKRGVPLKELRAKGLRILLRPCEGSGIDVRFCVAGVAVEGSAKIAFPIPWSAWVDDPGLELDASLKSAVKGERLEAALRAVEEAATVHSLLLMGRRHERAMRLAGALLAGNPGLRSEWMRLMKSGLPAVVDRLEAARRPGGLKRLLGGRLSGDRLRVLECALVCAHLRGPAQDVSLDPKRGGGDPIKFCLWRVPLEFDPEGKPLSMRDLAERRDERPPPS